ncbi:MAG: putative redox-active family protein [Clostridium sp.]
MHNINLGRDTDMNGKDEFKNRAVALFEQGYNCSQSVFGAYCTELGIDFETGLKISSSFGAGMGRLREVCGAVTGMFMVAGLKYGYTDPKDDVKKAEHYRLIQELASKFKEKNDTIICRELLGLGDKKESYVPNKRTKEYYKTRPCAHIIEDAAEIIYEFIKNEEIENK